MVTLWLLCACVVYMVSLTYITCIFHVKIVGLLQCFHVKILCDYAKSETSYSAISLYSTSHEMPR